MSIPMMNVLLGMGGGSAKAGLVSWWDFNNTLSDLHGGNNLQLISEGNSVGTATYSTGKVGTGVAVKAGGYTEGNISYLRSLGAIDTNKNMTLGGWFKWDAGGTPNLPEYSTRITPFTHPFTFGNLEYIGLGTVGGYQINELSSGISLLGILNTFVFLIMEYHVATRQVFIYKNNAAIGQATVPVGSFNTTLGICGSRKDGVDAEPPVMVVDSAFYYDKLLTSSEKDHLYNNGSGITYNTL